MMQIAATALSGISATLNGAAMIKDSACEGATVSIAMIMIFPGRNLIAIRRFKIRSKIAAGAWEQET